MIYSARFMGLRPAMCGYRRRCRAIGARKFLLPNRFAVGFEKWNHSTKSPPRARSTVESLHLGPHGRSDAYFAPGIGEHPHHARGRRGVRAAGDAVFGG